MRKTSKATRGIKEASIIATAFMVRLLYALTFVWNTAETEKYINLAIGIRVGVFSLEGVSTTVAPILLPLIASPFPTIESFLLLQVFLGSLTCWLAYLIARKARISSWGTWLLVFAPLPIHYTAAVLPDTLLIFLIAVAVYFWIARNWYAAGFAFGLAALTGPIVLPLLAFTLLVTLLLKQSLKPVLLIAGIATVVALPWMIRNSVVEGQPMLTQQSTLAKDLLYGTFTKEELSDADLTETAARFQKETYSSAVIDRTVFSPLSWTIARIEQYPRLFIHTGGDLTSNLVLRLLIVLVQLGIGIFALIGLRDLPLPLWIVPLFLAIFYLPFWIDPRYFLPAMPFVCLAAGVGFKKMLLKTRPAKGRQTAVKNPESIEVQEND